MNLILQELTVMKILELYYSQNSVAVPSNSSSDSLEINTPSNIYNFGSGLYLSGGSRALAFVFYHRLNSLSGML